MSPPGASDQPIGWLTRQLSTPSRLRFTAVVMVVLSLVAVIVVVLAFAASEMLAGLRWTGRAMVGGEPTPWHLSIWLVPALELAALAPMLLGRRREQRSWTLIASLGVGLAAAHFAYRWLIPDALGLHIPLRAWQLGLLLHLLETGFFIGTFLSLSLMTARRIGLPTRGVTLDALIGGCGALTAGLALVVPASTVTAASGWAELGVILVALGAIAPIALLFGMLTILRRAPAWGWWGVLIGNSLLAIATAITIVPISTGVDARTSLGWLLWPVGLFLLSLTSRASNPPPERSDERQTQHLITATLFSLSALVVLAISAVDPRPPVVLVLAFLTLLAAIARMTFAVRSAMRLNEHDRVQSRRLRDARDEALAAGRAKSDFLATMSHEIRTPLGAVIGMSEVLTRGRLDPVQREQVEHIRRSGTLILELVNDVLDRASLDANQLTLESQPLEVAEVLGDVVELLRVAADAKGIHLHAEIDAACPEWVRGDATRLRQVLINLIGNAVKYTENGEVTVEVCPAARLHEPAVYFQVSDTGSGIPAEQISRLFTPFTQAHASSARRRDSTGLGLSISQALVHRMGGEITATSQEGVGSVFGFELVLPTEPVPPEVATALSGRRIAVIDDQTPRAERLAGQLRRWGATAEVRPVRYEWWTDNVDTVIVRQDHPDALEALGRLLRRHQGGDRPPLVLLTSNGFSTPTGELGPDDLVISAATSGGRLRNHLVQMHAQPEPEPAAEAPEPRSLRILLAEDDPASRRVCQLMVEHLGHTIDTVADGASAVRAALDGDYDLILMDSHLPEMDGPDAAAAIRQSEPEGRRVPIVALTGAIAESDLAEYAAAGMDRTLAKPVTRAALAELLSHYSKPLTQPYVEAGAKR